ncbi:imidazolonepropionase [Candidatus Bipolaricaulota bacterium]|nr:imidazolonepropionase [Candidatus Bipolaricaulota bacterium]
MSTIITDIGQLVTPVGGPRPLSGKKMKELSLQRDVQIRIKDGKIAAVEARGKEADSHDLIIDAGGGVVIPGLIDPHTHAVFAGTREEEFLARCQDRQYNGGGITSTARRVAQTSEEELIVSASHRLKEMLSHGTTTIEIKSGYGLDMENEIKILNVIKRLDKENPLRFVATFLGAHSFPSGMRRADYISSIITTMIPYVSRHRLAKFCDVFCDRGFYTINEARTILRAARGAGLLLKLHADELTSIGGAELAAQLEATSADHLLRISDRGIEAMKEAGVIAVLLPGTAFSLNRRYAPARKMIDAGLPIALASDFNPGTCLINSQLLIIGLAVMKMGLTIEEALTAATLNAAASLEMADAIGSLEEGKSADLVILDLDNYRQIPYFFGHNPVMKVLINGQLVWDRERNRY